MTKDNKGDWSDLKALEIIEQLDNPTHVKMHKHGPRVNYVAQALMDASEQARVAEQDRLIAIMRSYAESKPDSHPGVLCTLEIQEMYADSCRRAQPEPAVSSAPKGVR
jgi:hypothetical protein